MEPTPLPPEPQAKSLDLICTLHNTDLNPNPDDFPFKFYNDGTARMYLDWSKLTCPPFVTDPDQSRSRTDCRPHWALSVSVR